MWAISLLQAVRFCLRHVSEDELKDKLGQLLDIYEELLEPERKKYEDAIGQFFHGLDTEEATDGK